VSRSDDSLGGALPWRGTDGDVDGAYLVERAITVASALLIAALLGYLFWQALVTPSAALPAATVESVDRIDAGEDPRLLVSVALSNHGEKGLSSAQVTVTCGDRSRTLEFANVPAGGHTTGTVTCPAGTDPRATPTAWIEA